MCNPSYKSFFFCIKQDLLPFMCVCMCIASNYMISQNVIKNVVYMNSVFKVFVYAILYVYDSCLYSNIFIFIFFWITLIHCGCNVSSQWIDAISVVCFCGWFAYQEITLLLIGVFLGSVSVKDGCPLLKQLSFPAIKFCTSSAFLKFGFTMSSKKELMDAIYRIAKQIQRIYRNVSKKSASIPMSRTADLKGLLSSLNQTKKRSELQRKSGSPELSPQNQALTKLEQMNVQVGCFLQLSLLTRTKTQISTVLVLPPFPVLISLPRNQAVRLLLSKSRPTMLLFLPQTDPPSYWNVWKEDLLR